MFTVQVKKILTFICDYFNQGSSYDVLLDLMSTFNCFYMRRQTLEKRNHYYNHHNNMFVCMLSGPALAMYFFCILERKASLPLTQMSVFFLFVFLISDSHVNTTLISL